MNAKVVRQIWLRPGKILDLSRERCRTLVGVISGHYHLGAHLRLIRMIEADQWHLSQIIDVKLLIVSQLMRLTSTLDIWDVFEWGCHDHKGDVKVFHIPSHIFSTQKRLIILSYAKSLPKWHCPIKTLNMTTWEVCLPDHRLKLQGIQNIKIFFKRRNTFNFLWFPDTRNQNDFYQLWMYKKFCRTNCYFNRL